MPQTIFPVNFGTTQEEAVWVREGALTSKGDVGSGTGSTTNSCVKMVKPFISAQKDGLYLDLMFQSLSFLLWTIIQSTEVEGMRFLVKLPGSTIHELC